MSVDVLRRAAVAIRAENTATGSEAVTGRTLLAVADWLDKTASKYESIREDFSPNSQVGAAVAESNTLAYDEALAVARAYLGEDQ